MPAREPGFVNQAWELVQQQPADLVYLSKPRLPEPRELMGPLWTRLAVDLAQRFDGIFGGLLSQPPGVETCRES